MPLRVRSQIPPSNRDGHKMALTMAKPKPEPLPRVVKLGSNACCATSSEHARTIVDDLQCPAFNTTSLHSPIPYGLLGIQNQIGQQPTQLILVCLDGDLPSITNDNSMPGRVMQLHHRFHRTQRHG